MNESYCFIFKNKNMNICEYRVKKTFFLKIEILKNEYDMSIVQALNFIWIKKTTYYECKKTSMISKWIVKKILRNNYTKSIFNVSDFEKIW